MAKNIQEERLRWVRPIANKDISLSQAAKVCPYSRRSLERWLTVYRQQGEVGLCPRSTRPHTNPKETSIALKERIIALRRQTRLCALKLSWKLKEEGIIIHPRTIGKIIRADGLTRRYRSQRVKYKYLRAELKPGELMEIDVKHVPGKVANRRYCQYTAIDCASRWRYLAIYEGESNGNSLDFLVKTIRRFPYPIRAVKTDNGSIFTNWATGVMRRSDRTIKTLHCFDRFCAQGNIIHYLIDPGKPSQNGMVERSHRSDQERFYDRHWFVSAPDLRSKLKRWNIYYNNLAHCGLNGLSPNQFLTNYQLANNTPNVRT